MPADAARRVPGPAARRPAGAGRGGRHAAAGGAAPRGHRRRAARPAAGHPFRGRRILFHGHCHQKALAGTAATVALLRSIPGADVTEVDAGCCGMAGSFGFEAEHYELSMRIGGLRLFPAIRAEPQETVIAATGVSCRQQIEHGTGRPARHPLEIIRQALPVPGQ